MILAAVPRPCRRALDVGCGEGSLARALRERVDHVVGIDRDSASIELARAQGPEDIEYVLGDVLTHPLEPASFDLVTAVASLHHMDAEIALRRMADLLRTGGVLAVIGLARSRFPADRPREVAAVAAHRWFSLRRSVWHHPSPLVWPPPETYAGMREIAAAILPGVRFRRHVMWRYSLVWVKQGRTREAVDGR